MRVAFNTKMYLAMGLVLSALAVPLIASVTAQAAQADPQGTIYVADGTTNSIDVFAAGTNGNVAPVRTISGPLTGMGANGEGPDDVKVDSSGDVYASNFASDSITEYAPGASGNVAPICTISGSNTGLDYNDDISLASDGTIYVGNFEGAYPVEVFAPGACGNVAPERTIAGPLTGLGLIDGLGVDATGTLYVDNSEDSTIDVFAPGASGNVAPEYSIAGSLTGLSAPDDIVVGFTGQLFVTNGFGSGINNVEVFAAGASGNVAPVQDISGSNTDFGNPDDLAVDPAGDIYVTDSGSTIGPAMLEWAAGSTGNVAPTTAIAGSSTSFVEPEGVAVAGPGITTDSLTSSISAPSITLGESTQDTAILSNGSSPTGQIEFKLFGPGDPSCSAAPAYTSPLTPVDGNGSYVSPSFTPTAAGTYSWLDLYSGDSNNAPASTVCGATDETLTVTSTCDTGPWPSQVTGVPTVNPGEPRGFYIGVNPDNGEWVLQDTHNLTDPPHFITYSGTITTDGTFTNVMPISLQAHDKFTISPDQHTLTFSFPDGGHVDALGFTPTCGSTLTFQGSIKGIPTPTTQINLGVPASHPSTNPVTFTRSS